MSGEGSGGGSSEGRAWGWAAALRTGSTTPWSAWSEDGEPAAHRLPGAQQLALLHRLNVHAAGLGRTVPAATADRVLAGDLTGRGRSELRLVGAGEAPSYGPRPVDPDTLDPEELLRVATALIAEDVAATARRAPAPASDGLTQRLARRAARAGLGSRARHEPFVVVGVPWRVGAVEDSLRAQGREPGAAGREPVVYLLAEDLATAVVHAWTSRSFDQGGHGWLAFVRAAATGGRVPPRADLLAMARAARQRWGVERVRIVLDTAAMAAELGVPRIEEPAPLGADAIGLARRVGEPLGLLVDERLRPGLLRAALEPRLAGRGGPLPTVDDAWATWLLSHAERARHGIEAAGHVVLGDVEALVPSPPPSTTIAPRPAGILDLALGLLLDPVGPGAASESPR